MSKKPATKSAPARKATPRQTVEEAIAEGSPPAAPPPAGDEPANPVHDEAGTPPGATPVESFGPADDPVRQRALDTAVQSVADSEDAKALLLMGAEPHSPEPRLPPVTAAFARLDQVRSLPEVVGAIDTQPVEFAPGSIERFKASETDRRTMEVIALPGMGFAVRAVEEA